MITVHKEGNESCHFHIAVDGGCLCGCDTAKPCLVSINVWKGLNLEGLPNCYCVACMEIGIEKGVV